MDLETGTLSLADKSMELETRHDLMTRAWLETRA